MGQTGGAQHQRLGPDRVRDLCVHIHPLSLQSLWVKAAAMFKDTRQADVVRNPGLQPAATKEPSWKWILWPQTGLQMAAALAGTLTSLGQQHPVKLPPKF